MEDGVEGRDENPFAPTDRDRRQVEMLAGFGIPHEQICLMLIGDTGEPISLHTLYKYFRKELDTGAVKANAQVVGALFKNATGEGAGSTTAQIWWTKARMGWREQTPEVPKGEGGANAPAGYVAVPMPIASMEEWSQKVQRELRESQDRDESKSGHPNPDHKPGC